MSTPVKPGCSPLLAEALQRRNMLCRAETGGRAALLQLSLAGLCLYDANNLVLLGLLTSQPAPLAASLLYLVEMSLFAVLATSFLSSLWTLLAPLHSLAPLSLTDQQFRLLRLHPSSPGFTKSPDPSQVPSSPLMSPLPGHLTHEVAYLELRTTFAARGRVKYMYLSPSFLDHGGRSVKYGYVVFEEVADAQRILKDGFVTFQKKHQIKLKKMTK